MYIVSIILFAVIGSRLMWFLTEDALNELFAAGMTINQYYLFEVVALVIAMIVAVFVRIAGQYVFGRFMGFRFCLLQIGRRALVKIDGKYSMRRYRRVTAPLIFMMHPSGVTRMKWVMAMIGGVPANLIASAAFLLFSRAVGPAAEFMLVFSGLLCGFIAVMEAIPMRVRGGDTVGKAVVKLFRNERAVAIAERNNLVTELGLRGLRTKDMPEELFRGNEEMTDSTTVAIWKAIYATRLMDEGKYTEAKEIMREAVNSGNLQKWETVAGVCDAIMCEAAGECDMEKIRKMLNPWLKKQLKKNADMPFALRTRYIEELLINKNADAAQKVRERFENAAADYLKPGVIESCRENFVIIDKKAKEIA